MRVSWPVNGAQVFSPWATGAAGSVPADEVEPDAPTGGEAEERTRAARRFRADAERIAELYADFTRMLIDGAASLAEQAVGAPPAADGRGSGPEVLILGPASAGATTTASAWLHVLDGPPAPPAPVHATDLVAHDGGRVPSAALRCVPDHLDTTTARRTAEVRVTVTVPADTPPGSYHGHLLASGLPEVVLPLRLEVVA
jgi:hypothetical protein